jgi:hypothetical protein
MRDLRRVVSYSFRWPAFQRRVLFHHPRPDDEGTTHLRNVCQRLHGVMSQKSTLLYVQSKYTDMYHSTLWEHNWA